LSRRLPLGAALFAVLVIGAFVTAGAVLRAKTPKLALEVTRLDQRLTPHAKTHRVAHLRFYVRYTDAHARVTIVGQGLTPARTLAANRRLQANRPVAFTWNGRTDSGAPAPSGTYALRVNLPDRDRNMLWVATRIHLDQSRR
jgi:hypothetical protein